MRLFLDEQLSPKVAKAMQAVRLGCDAVGAGGCPEPGSSDDDVVRWCLEREAILVTADRGRKRREMRVALERHRVPVVRLPKPMLAVPLLRTLLNGWDGIEEALRLARARKQQMIVTLDPITGKVSRVRRGG